MTQRHVAQLATLLRSAADPDMDRAAGAYRVAVANRDLEGLPAAEMVLLRAAGAAGWASEVYPITQAIRAALGLPRRERMDPQGRGQPSPHPEEGQTARPSLALPEALLARMAEAAAEDGVSMAVWTADAIRERLLRRLGASADS